ncbi:class I SAM-dependent methyltransferase [Salegentibacter chungangensis]|uniref:Class I SAM-dependent methyltransferase n=1 Tax=Salegentibacter chungangensis TaxID=1335724 RepID=A0ABW3NT35_9FLAO
MEDRKQHWEEVYDKKKLTEVSWYQPIPETSLDFIEGFRLQKDAKIIDVGGGDSFLVDHLLERGYTNITVLDISAKAIERAKQRLGEKAGKVTWIVSDAAEFQPEEQYDVWHDRAAFHFLTEEPKIESYLENLKKGVKPGGYVVLGTFSEKGPEKCSGLFIHQYSKEEMSGLFREGFKMLKCINVDHKTPSEKIQNFTFCSFRKEE